MRSILPIHCIISLAPIQYPLTDLNLECEENLLYVDHRSVSSITLHLLLIYVYEIYHAIVCCLLHVSLYLSNSSRQQEYRMWIDNGKYILSLLECFQDISFATNLG